MKVGVGWVDGSNLSILVCCRVCRALYPYSQLLCTLPPQDTFLTSWSSERGYHLYCWEKTFFTPYITSAASAEECKEAALETTAPPHSSTNSSNE